MNSYEGYADCRVIVTILVGYLCVPLAAEAIERIWPRIEP